MRVFEFALMGGVLVGLFYCLMSLGLNLSFGVLRILNVAHGNVVIFTAFLTWELVYALGWNPLTAMGIAAPAAFAAGLATHYLIAPRLGRSTDPEMFSLVFFFGISQALEAIATQAFSSNPRAINQGFMTGAPVSIFGQSYPEVWVVAAITTVPVVLLLAWYLYRTKLGRATQALMSNPQDAQATGINIQRTAAFALAISSLAIVARVTRTAIRQESEREHVQTAISRGIPWRQLVRRHVLRNAAIPITTISGITIASLIAVAAVVETAFSLNGLGAYLVQAAQSKDLAVVQGISLLLVTAFVVINVLVDFAYALLDPRVALGSRAA